MAYLQQLFREAAREVNRPYEELVPILKLFEDNWFDSASAIQAMGDGDFESLKVPKRLMIVLRQLSTGKTIVRHAVSSSQQHQPTYEEVFEEFTDRLKHETSLNKRTMLESTRLLSLILKNIVENPCQEKFRRLKLSNKKVEEHISCYPCCGELLEFMGFDKHEDCYLMLQVEFDHLQFTSNYLKTCIAAIEAMYDPYQSSLEPEMPRTITTETTTGSTEPPCN